MAAVVRARTGAGRHCDSRLAAVIQQHILAEREAERQFLYDVLAEILADEQIKVSDLERRLNDIERRSISRDGFASWRNRLAARQQAAMSPSAVRLERPGHKASGDHPAQRQEGEPVSGAHKGKGPLDCRLED